MRMQGRKDAGFSLIELAVLLVITGLLTSAALETYRSYSITKEINDTEVRRGLVQNALSQYVRFFGRLPCPADPDLPPDDGNAGVEICPDSPPAPYASVPYPNNGCAGEVCRVDGRRDTGADGNLVPDKVLHGAVPYVTIGLTLQDTIDGWGGKMTYAVSEFLTDSGTYSDNWGTVNKQIKQSGTGSIIDGSPVGENLLVIVSHGPDRKGAWNYYGNRISPCAGVALDVENCDGDSTFILASDSATCEADNTCIVSYAPGANFFDDAFTEFEISRDSDKWQYASATSIENKTGGNVGIGVTSPNERLHVDGNVLITSSAVGTDGDAHGDVYCDQNENNCFNSEIIAGPGINCSSGLMVGVSDEQVDCVNTIDTTGITPSICPSGQYVTGIDAAGALICN